MINKLQELKKLMLKQNDSRVTEIVVAEVIDYLSEQNKPQSIPISTMTYDEAIEGFNKIEKQMINGELMNLTIEVGQIWRSNQNKLLKIVKNIELNHINIEYITFKHDENKLSVRVYVKNLLKDYTLVTMDNIKENEWVQCITKNHDALNYGERYQVFLMSCGSFKYIIHDGGGSINIDSIRGASYFKPCLPPQKSQGLTIEEFKKVPHKHIDRVELLQSRIEDLQNENKRLREDIDEYESERNELYTKDQVYKAIEELLKLIKD